MLDPLEGLRANHGLVAVMAATFGLVKGLVGLGLRPGAGSVELICKLLQGIGLLCLGKKGIQVRGSDL